MKTLRLSIFCLGLTTILLLLACLAYGVKPNRNITPKNFERIQVGMPEAEVEHILGGPAGDYLTAPEPEDSDFELFAMRFNDLSPKHKRWKGDELCVFIDFDEEGRVRVKRWMESTPRPANFFQKLRRLIP